MHINLAKSAGFCSGVKRALKIAYQTAQRSKGVEMLGDIVHNESVVKDIAKVDIKKVRRLAKGRSKTLLIRAHGAPKKIYMKAAQLGYTIVDATCPMVKEIHTLAARLEQEGYKVIVIGDKKHDEVRGIVGQLKNKAIVIDGIKNIPSQKLKNIKRAAVVVQSTQNLEKVLKIVDILKTHIKDLTFCNTICNPTKIKQEEIKHMPLKNDVMLIIGSKNSANTKRLYEISCSLNPRSFWIQSKNQVKSSWFRNARSVGITAGASTPHYTTGAVIEHVKKITSKK